MIDTNLLTILAVSLGLGLLVGLQREYVDKPMAGIRTFGLITLMGTIMGLISQQLESGWIIGAGAIAIAILFATANFIQNDKEGYGLGQTTEIAALLMYGLGAYLVIGDLKIGVILGALTAVLLHFKEAMEGFIDRLSGKAIKAVIQFAAISLIILPVLPNKTFGPYDVLNPFDIWLMVVLIVGLSLVGFFIYKLFSHKTGTLASGILGGLISSTATTVTYSKRAKEMPEVSMDPAFIIVAASAVALVRVMVEVSIVSPGYLMEVAPPIAAELGVLLIICGLIYWRINRDNKQEEMPEPDNPAQLKTAFVFAFLYALILIGVAAAKDFFGQSGLYIVSIISGLTDVDAITLSLSNTLNRGDIEVSIAWRLILLASLANLLFKGILAAVLGPKKLLKYIGGAFGIAIITGLLIIWLWP